MRFHTWLSLGLALAAAPASATNIVTYHYDNARTGWNPAETSLTAANVATPNFGLLAQIPLDDQVDAQPLFMAAQTIVIKGAASRHDTIYVVTENNTLYAIDANTHAILLSRNFGAPVPIANLPGGCNNNANNVGITATPVIDATTGTLYAITYTLENNAPVYRLHAISLATLQDAQPSTIIGATGTLANHTPSAFDPTNTRQRPALLQAGGNIYAGFGSFCDFGNVSRGWVLGWNAATLAPLPAGKLTNTRPTSPYGQFLTAIWMSGYGIAADSQNNLFFATGNSDGSGQTWNATTNLAESVVKLSPDLTTVESYFTPKGGSAGVVALDQSDNDFGAGGVLLLPDQAGAFPHLAIAAGKWGPTYLLNRDALGGAGNKTVTLGAYQNQNCWCGPSYFTGADGIGRVVSSTGTQFVLWKLAATPRPVLLADGHSPVYPQWYDPGFFTSISSNGTAPGSAVIWGLTRPSSLYPDPLGVYLKAVNPNAKMHEIFSAEAGIWPFAGSANANLVPVTANGQVFVASYQNLSIFGLATPARPLLTFHAPARPAPAVFAGLPHTWHGVVTATGPARLTLRTRDGALHAVDIAPAERAGTAAKIKPGQAAVIRGDSGSNGPIAQQVLHLKSDAGLWPADR